MLRPSSVNRLRYPRQQKKQNLMPIAPRPIHHGVLSVFVQYYEQNRFGDAQSGIGKSDDKNKDAKNELRSSLSSLTGDEVSVGTNRIFFANVLRHLCASVAGFSAVEAALELGQFVDKDEEDKGKGKGKGKGTDVSAAVTGAKAAVATHFHESSECYKQALITELGNLLQTRAVGANLEPS
jgi:hypothetical protein